MRARYDVAKSLFTPARVSMSENPSLAYFTVPRYTRLVLLAAPLAAVDFDDLPSGWPTHRSVLSFHISALILKILKNLKNPQRAIIEYFEIFELWGSP